MAEKVDRMCKADIIEPATTEWASPVVIAPEHDGSYRMCIDYRKRNSETIRDTYLLPRMDECIHIMGGGSVVFSTLDADCDYWQMPVEKEEKEKTTFSSAA